MPIAKRGRLLSSRCIPVAPRVSILMVGVRPLSEMAKANVVEIFEVDISKCSQLPEDKFKPTISNP